MSGYPVPSPNVRYLVLQFFQHSEDERLKLQETTTTLVQVLSVYPKVCNVSQKVEINSLSLQISGKMNLRTVKGRKSIN